MTRRGRVSSLALLWMAVAATSVCLVVYVLGPLIQEREQRASLSEFRTEVSRAAHADEGPLGVSETDEAPAPEVGESVGVLEIGDLELQQVVIEGVSPSETRRGPGHVPGTAGLGQPGNSVVVARRNSFGGSFEGLEGLDTGDRILVHTEQGQSVYVVDSTRRVGIVEDNAGKHEVTRDKLLGKSSDDRLTLVTSAARQPWNTRNGVVVVAKLRGKPFAPTFQGAKTESQTDIGSEDDAAATIILAIGGYALAVGSSILAYRILRFRVAYAITIAPLVAVTVISAETLSRLLPSWT